MAGGNGLDWSRAERADGSGSRSLGSAVNRPWAIRLERGSVDSARRREVRAARRRPSGARLRVKGATRHLLDLPDRLQDDARPRTVRFDPPEAGDAAVDQECWEDVPIAGHDGGPGRLGQDAGAVLVREQGAFSHRQEARRRRSVGERARGVGEIQERSARVVAQFDHVRQGLDGRPKPGGRFV